MITIKSQTYPSIVSHQSSGFRGTKSTASKTCKCILDLIAITQDNRDTRDVCREDLRSNDHKNARRILLEKAIDINDYYLRQRYFQYSITRRRLKAAPFLIEQGRDWDFGEIYADILEFSTPEWLYDILKMILQTWDSCNVQLNDGTTLLLWALEHSDINIIILLQDHGADFTARDWNREGTLHYAICNRA